MQDQSQTSPSCEGVSETDLFLCLSSLCIWEYLRKTSFCILHLYPRVFQIDIFLYLISVFRSVHTRVIADMDTSFFPLEENLTLWLGQRNIKDFLFKVRFLKE
jgi:hypothetical protein